MYENFENKNMKELFPLVRYTYPSNLSEITQFAEHLTVMKSERLHFLFVSDGRVGVANGLADGVEAPELHPQAPSFTPGVNRNIALHALPLLGIPHFPVSDYPVQSLS